MRCKAEDVGAAVFSLQLVPVEKAEEFNTLGEAQLIGMKDNRVTRQPLVECVARTHKVADLESAGDFEGALAGRGDRDLTAERLCRRARRLLCCSGPDRRETERREPNCRKDRVDCDLHAKPPVSHQNGRSPGFRINRSRSPSQSLHPAG